MSGQTPPMSSTPVGLSSPLAPATQYSSPSPIRLPTGLQVEGEGMQGRKVGRRGVQGVQETTPTILAPTGTSAPAMGSRPSSTSTSTSRGFVAPANSHTGFIMASSLPRSQGTNLTPEVLWTKHHDNSISGVCYRLFIKPLDRSRPQTEGSFTVMYSGHTSLYVLAVPGGGFNISSFKTHLAREGWGAYSPASRSGNFTKEGTLLPPQSFGSLLSIWFKSDYTDFMRFKKPEVVDITQVFSLGDVIWRLYSCGILDHGNENMGNLRMQYQLLPLPAGAKKSLTFTDTAVESSSAGVVATSKRPVDGWSSSEEEDDEVQEFREEDTRKEADRAGAVADLEGLELVLDDEADEDDVKESIVNKNKNLRIKFDKLRKVAGKALRCADHFKGRVEKTELRRMRNTNKSITKCVEACVKSKFEMIVKSTDETNSVILSLKTELGSVAAKTNLLLKKFDKPLTPNFPPPPSPFQQQPFFHKQQQQLQVPPPQQQQLQGPTTPQQLLQVPPLLQQQHLQVPPPPQQQQQATLYLVQQEPVQHQSIQGQGQGQVFNTNSSQGHVYQSSNGQGQVFNTSTRQGHIYQGHVGHQAPQFQASYQAPPSLRSRLQVPAEYQPPADLDEILASLTSD